MENKVIDEMTITRRDPPFTDDYKIPILYRDDDIIIVDKPYDLRVDGDFTCTLEKYLRDLPNARPSSLMIKMDKFRLANQLDFATSGAVVITLNKIADRETSALFQFRLTKKLYIAVGEGWVDDDELMKCRLISKPIAPVEGEFRMKISEEGQPSSTIAVPVINTYCSGGTVKCTVFVLRLLTGRRHQLRLHLSNIGHPILGDYTYANHLINGGRSESLPRMLLHAWRLTLPFGDLLHCKGKLRKRGQLRHVKDGITISVEASEASLLKYVNPMPGNELLEEAARLALNYTQAQSSDIETSTTPSPQSSSEHVDKKVKYNTNRER